MTAQFNHINSKTWFRKQPIQDTLDLNGYLLSLKPNESKIIKTTTDAIIAAILTNTVKPNINNRGGNKSILTTGDKAPKSLKLNVNPHSLGLIHIVYIENLKEYRLADGHTRLQYFIDLCNNETTVHNFDIHVELHRLVSEDDYNALYRDLNIHQMHTATVNYSTNAYALANVIEHFSIKFKFKFKPKMRPTFGYIVHNLIQNPTKFSEMDYIDIIDTRGNCNALNISSSLDKNYLKAKSNPKLTKAIRIWTQIANKIEQEIANLNEQAKKTSSKSVKSSCIDKISELKKILNASGLFGMVIMDSINESHGILGKKPMTLAQRVIKNSKTLEPEFGSITRGNKNVKRKTITRIINMLQP